MDINSYCFTMQPHTQMGFLFHDARDFLYSSILHKISLKHSTLLNDKYNGINYCVYSCTFQFKALPLIENTTSKWHLLALTRQRIFSLHQLVSQFARKYEQLVRGTLLKIIKKSSTSISFCPTSFLKSPCNNNQKCFTMCHSCPHNLYAENKLKHNLFGICVLMKSCAFANLFWSYRKSWTAFWIKHNTIHNTSEHCNVFLFTQS